MDWRHYLSVVWRRKWLVALVTVLGTAGGIAATRFIPPVYEAKATIWIEVKGNDSRGPIQSEELLRSSAWVDLLKTYLVLDHVVRDRKLYLKTRTRVSREPFEGFDLREKFVPGDYRLVVDEWARGYELHTDGGEVVEAGLVGDSIGGSIGLAWRPDPDALKPRQEIEFTVTAPRDEATRLASELQTVMDRNGHFLRVSLRGEEPERIAESLNAVTDRYVQVAAELKGAKLEQLKEILNDQLEYAAGHLEEAEVALEDYRVETITLPSEPATPVVPGLQSTRDPAFSNFFELKIESEQLRRDREGILRVLEEVPDSGLSVEALEIIPSVAQSSELSTALEELTRKRAELRALGYRYTDQHEPVQQRRAEIETLESDIIPKLARSLVSELGARERELSQLIDSASGQLSEVPTRAIEEARLERRVAIAANLYTTLKARYEEARLAAASSIPDVRVLDPAVAPQRPINRKSLYQLVLLAAVGSLGLAAAGALVMDRMDSRLRYPNEISRSLGVPVLGTVPEVKERRRGLKGESAMQVIESFRVIRLNLLHAYGKGPVVLTVTSPEPQDGKSFVSSNLGLAFAELGKRTLVIDADVRRGSQHHLLGGARKPGLTDALAGLADLQSVTRKTQHRLLGHIPSGSRRQDGPELLQSPDMARLLSDVRQRYDVILLDSPPLAAGVDPLALGTLSGNMVIVLRTGVTDREMTEAKLDMLGRLPIRLLGAVLNAVPAGKGGYYQYYSYLPGYEARDEEGVLESAPRGRLIAPSDEAEEGSSTQDDDIFVEIQPRPQPSGETAPRVSAHDPPNPAVEDKLSSAAPSGAGGRTASETEPTASPAPREREPKATHPARTKGRGVETEPGPSSAVSDPEALSEAPKPAEPEAFPETPPASGTGPVSNGLWVGERARAAAEEVRRQAEAILDALDTESEPSASQEETAADADRIRAYRKHQQRVQNWKA